MGRPHRSVPTNSTQVEFQLTVSINRQLMEVHVASDIHHPTELMQWSRDKLSLPSARLKLKIHDPND